MNRNNTARTGIWLKIIKNPRYRRAVITLVILGLAISLTLWKNYPLRKVRAQSSPITFTGYASYLYNTLKHPTGIAMVSNMLIIADTGNNVIREFTPSTGLTVLAGNGTAGYADGSYTSAEFNFPTGLSGYESEMTFPGTITPNVWLTVIVNDSGNGVVREVCRSITGAYGCPVAPGSVTTVTGTNSGVLVSPAGFSGTLTNGLIADASKNTVRQLSSSGTTLLAGNSNSGYVNGPVTSAEFHNPTMAISAPNGTLVVDMGNHALRLIHSGNVTTLAGNGLPGYANGTGVNARFYYPTAATYNSSDGYFYVADTFNNCIRKVSTSGVVTTYAGIGGVGGLVNGALASAKFDKPTSLFISGTYMYIADSNNNAIRRIDMSAGQVTTYID